MESWSARSRDRRTPGCRKPELYVAPAGTVREEARLISSLAWPVSAGQVGLISMGVVALAMVGRLGPEPLAALGIANTLVFGTLLVGLGTAHGIDPLVAQAYGAGRDRDAAVDQLAAAQDAMRVDAERRDRQQASQQKARKLLVKEVKTLRSQLDMVRRAAAARV